LVDEDNVCALWEHADAAGAEQLARFCLHYCLEAYPRVAVTPSYAQLPMRLRDDLLATMHRLLRLLLPLPDSSAHDTDAGPDPDAEPAIEVVEHTGPPGAPNDDEDNINDDGDGDGGGR
jgi:hypothetical protein